MMGTVFESMREEARQDVWQEVLQKARQEVQQESAEEARLQVARRMLEDEVPLEVTSRHTDLPIAALRALQEASKTVC